MGEAIGWIILIIIVIALVVGLVSLVVKVLFASVAAILAGVVAGYLVLFIADWVQVRKLSDPSTLARVASLRLTSAGLKVEFTDAQVQRWANANSLNWLASLSSGGIATWALYLCLADTLQIKGAMGDLNPLVRFLSWLTPGLLMFVFGKGAGMNGYRKGRVRRVVESA